jgi:hypothetical protein
MITQSSKHICPLGEHGCSPRKLLPRGPTMCLREHGLSCFLREYGCSLGEYDCSPREHSLGCSLGEYDWSLKEHGLGCSQRNCSLRDCSHGHTLVDPWGNNSLGEQSKPCYSGSNRVPRGATVFPHGTNVINFV